MKDRSQRRKVSASSRVILSWIQWLLWVVGMAWGGASSAWADLELDIRDRTVVAGESGTFEVLLRTRQSKQTMVAWDTELIVDSGVDLIEFQRITQVPQTPASLASANFQAALRPGSLQIQGAAFSFTKPATLTAADGWVPLIRVAYTIAPTAAPGSIIAINFSPNAFTNAVDDQFAAVPITRSGGSLTVVSAVPEPGAWFGGLLVCTAIAIRGWQQAKRRSAQQESR